MQQVGAAVDSPMTLLREHTAAIRDLLAGETVDVRGRYVQLDRVTLDWPPAEPPVLLVGARGPRTITLAGEEADGVLLDTVTDPEVVRRARALVGEKQVSAYTPVATDVDPAELRRWVGELADAGADAVILQAPDEAPDALPLIAALAGISGSG